MLRLILQFGMAWLTPVVIAALSGWILVLQIHARARVVLWGTYLVWTSLWVWLWCSGGNHGRVWPYSTEEVVFVVGLCAGAVLGLCLIGLAELGALRGRRDAERTGFDVLPPDTSPPA